MKRLKAFVKRMLEGRPQHECEECKNVLPSHRARFHAGHGPVLMAVPKREPRTLESDLMEDR